MEKPLISVIVPVYNIIEYLPRCVHSIERQTWRDLEIILVDDGSDDGTGELCDRLALEDARVRVFHKENGGSSSARNLGLEKARGEYIGFVDSDDYIDEDMYERLYRGIEEYHTSAAQIGRDEIDAEGSSLPDICVPPDRPECIANVDFLRELLLHRGDCSFCTKLLRRDLFRDNRFPEGVLNEDFHLLVRLLPEIGTIVSLPGHAYHVFYRIGSNSRREKKDDFSRVFGDCVDNADMVAGMVKDSYPELGPVALRFGVFQRLEYLLHIPIGRMERENGQYRAVVGWLRRNWLRAMFNSHLTLKNKCYHTLFAIAPRGVRKIHRKIRFGSAGLVALLAVSILLASMPQSGLRAEAARSTGYADIQPVAAEMYAAAGTELQAIARQRDIMALIYLCETCEVRESALGDGAVVGRVSSGQTVHILDVAIVDEGDRSSAWAKISYFDGETERQGYVNRHYLACPDERFLAWEEKYGMDPGADLHYATDGGYSDIKMFPQSYHKALTELKKLHPKWTFVPLNTGLNWQTVVENEMKGDRSLVHVSLKDQYKGKQYHDDPNWFYATEEALNYYMDPRNGLTENGIFQFELLSFNESYHTETAVNKFLDNTFMNSSKNAPGTEKTFAAIFYGIGKEKQVSPFHLAARVYQEQGRGTSDLVSGKYEGQDGLYKGYYNYFNVKANGKSKEECIINGLKHAKEQEWSDAEKSISGGAELISKDYIKKGQDTLYLQKYDVNPNSGHALYTHQYMQNISAPTTEAQSIRKLYAETDSLDNTFVFKIPVYKDMPGDPEEKLPLAFDTDIALEIPDGYATDIWIDGVKYASEKKDGRNMVSAGDCNAKSAVVYRYDQAGNPTGMLAWTLDYSVNRYEATEQPQWKDLLSYEGLSVRVNEKPGIRFKTGISETMKYTLKDAGVNGYYLKEYGTLVMNQANMERYPMVKDGQKVACGMAYGKNAGGKLEDHICDTANGRQQFASVLSGLPAAQYKEKYAFRAYLVLEKDGSEIVLYGPVVTTSIYSLAEKVVAGGHYPAGSDADIFLRKVIADAPR